MDARNIPLRVLYTINSSPQYILARSSSPVPVFVLQDGATGNLNRHQCYATTLLKTCLDTICRSSPELVQDTARDFSVYVLDPLESNSAPAPVSISNNTSGSTTPPSTSTEPSNGVAVGLGLMSWAMAAGESGGVTVTGTLVKQGTGREALEVIFALRETAAMQKANLAAALKSWGTTIPTSTSNVIPTSQPPAAVTSSRPPGLSISSDFQLGVFGSLANLNPSNTKANLLQPPAPSTSANVSVTSAPVSLHIHSRKKPSKSKKCIKPAPTPSSEADKIMLSEETYIGPRRKKGRPAKASGATAGSVGQSSSGPGPLPSTKDVIIIDDPVLGSKTTADLNSCLNQSDSCRSEAANHHLVAGSVSSTDVTTASLHPDPIPTSPTRLRTSMTLLDILAYLSASSSSRDQNVQNAALLAALNAIDSPTNVIGPDDTSNPVLVNALKDLISAVSKQTLSPRSRDAQNSCPHTNDHRRVVSQDDEIVLLDKENVNPTAFRRRGERSETDKKLVDEELPTFLGGVRVSSLGSQQLSSPPSLNFDGTIHNRKTATRLNVQSASAAVRTSPSPVEKRKRTLSDFMEDRDSRMSSEQSRGKEAERRHVPRRVHSAGRRTSSMNASASGLRHYPRVLDQLQRRDTTGNNSYYRTGIEVWSSPPRSRNEDHSTADDGSDHSVEANTIDLSESPPSLRATASSPVRSQSRPRKRYIVPEWARTETSTQPRLSQAAQQALAETGENEGGRKKSRHRGEREKKRRATVSRSVSQTDADLEESMESVVLPTCPQPVASSSDCPIFAVTSAESGVPNLFQSTADSRSPGPLLSKSNLDIPKTPPRRRTDHTRTPGNGSGSLFTPASLRPSSRIFAGSPFLSSHGLFSPLSSKKTNTSPSSRSLVIGDLLSQLTSPATGTGKEADCSKDMEVALHQELDDALKQVDESCSSTSESDGDQNEECSSTNNGRPYVYPHSEISGNREDVTVNALWAGLPPSSPPPMSSPLLIPDACSDDEDMDDLDLPVATSDAEDCTTDSEAMPPSSDMPDLSTCSDQEFAEYLSNNDLGALLAAVDRPTVIDHSAEFDMDVFNQFTTLNAPSDGSYSDQNSDMTVDAEHMGLQNGLAEFDFTEFWETFKPLVQDHMLGSNTEPHPGFVQDGDIQTPEMIGSLDHTKLAEDVQALLSGCIV